MESRPVTGVPPVTQTDEHAADFQRGISLREARQFGESRRVLEQVVTGRLLSLGAQHSETLSAKSQLGRTLREIGQWERARVLHEECLAYRRQVLGNDHEWTKNSMRILADTLDGMGCSEDARRLREEAGRDPVNALPPSLKARPSFEIVLDPTTSFVGRKVAVQDMYGDLFSRKHQGKDNGMLSS